MAGKSKSGRWVSELWAREEKKWLTAMRSALKRWNGEEIRRVWIYMSDEKPTLLVNVESPEDPARSSALSVDLRGESFLSEVDERGRGFFLRMNLIEVRKFVKRFLPDEWSTDARGKTAAALRLSVLKNSAYWDEDRNRIESGIEEPALVDGTGARNLAEVLWAYRLAHVLRQQLDVEVLAAVHDSVEEIHKPLWDLAERYSRRPIGKYLAHVGLID